MLSARGRVKLCQTSTVFGCGPPAHLAGYLAPEYRPNKQCSDTETEKVIIYLFAVRCRFPSKKKIQQVPPRFELGSLDSKSRVLTVTPWNLLFAPLIVINFLVEGGWLFYA
jgi:hypothetical protein